MRFRRILVASLAPLITLSAWASGTAAPAADRAAHPQQYTMDSLVRLLAQLVAPTASHIATRASSEKPSAHAFLPLAALANAPLGHSLWMLHSAAEFSPHARRHTFAPLRC